MANFNVLEYQRMQLLEKLGQVAETMRLCANVADDFARTMSGKTLNPGVNPFSDVVSSVGQKTGKRKAQTLDDDDDDDAQEGKKKKRAPRKPKDPNAPKRPPSSYLMFQNDVRAELKSKFPELPNSELLQMISKRWAAMSDEDKEVYSKQNATAKEAYAAKKAIYDTANIAGAAASPTTAAAAVITPTSKKMDKSPPKTPAVVKTAKAAKAAPVPAPAEMTSSSDASEDSGSDSEESSEQGSDDEDEEEEPAPPPKKVKKVAPAVTTPKDKKEKKQRV